MECGCLIDGASPAAVRDADFKYANDSVLLVSHDDYKQCSTETPVRRFTGGDTKFTLDGLGPFYFVSGVPGHCEKGQRMIARVSRWEDGHDFPDWARVARSLGGTLDVAKTTSWLRALAPKVRALPATMRACRVPRAVISRCEDRIDRVARALTTLA